VSSVQLALGKRVDFGVEEVDLVAGTGEVSVAYTTSFLRAPQLLVIAHDADEAAGASYTSNAEDADGFTLKVAASLYGTATIRVRWYAFEGD